MIVSVAGLISVLFYWLVINFHLDGAYNQDLGRHLKLGEIIVNTGTVPFTNLFTYTHTEYPFVNHHWLSEVVYYFTHTLGGDTALLIQKIVLLILISILIWVFLGRSKDKIIWFVLSHIIFLPLFLERPDTRPEIFGYVFFTYLLCVLVEKRRIAYLIPIPICMALWVNMHITFVFGYFLLFFVAITYGRKSYPIVFLSFAATLLNPRFLYGAVFPFFIFKDYGYTIAENQSISLLLQVTNNSNLKYILLLLPAFFSALFSAIYAKKYALFLIGLTFMILTAFQARHLPFFVITILVASVYLGNLPWHLFPARMVGYLSDNRYLFVSVLLIGYSSFVLLFYGNMNEQNLFGTFGYSKDYERSTRFLMENRLPGPLFNNFDNGGYLDYKLYPTYLTFVDNRPDAFPGNFFKETYIPMQENSEAWEKAEKKYKFKTIIFSYTDQTPWAQSFIKFILSRAEWKLVYLDGTSFILTRSGNYIDIRSQPGKLDSIIDAEGNYKALVYLSLLLSSIKQNKLSVRAFIKAQSINPDSCSVGRVEQIYYSELNTNYYSNLAAQSKARHWYCF
ncbi:MAG: hypothetical protein WC775_00840 [Patescibacteria group bacterium]|jgi:hypothetical protein